jgi:hypothetical protein
LGWFFYFYINIFFFITKNRVFVVGGVSPAMGGVLPPCLGGETPLPQGALIAMKSWQKKGPSPAKRYGP